MKATVVVAAAFVVAACGGGGSSDPRPPVQSGKLDLAYGVAGKVTLADGMVAATVDASGNAYVTGAAIAKVDRSGTRVAGYGGPIVPPEMSPVIDSAGNLFTITFNATDPLHSGDIVKRNLAGQPDTSFGGIPVDFAPPGRVHIGASTAEDLHRDAAGNLLVVGAFRVIHPPFDSNTVVISKVDPSGRPVYSFGDGANKTTAIRLDLFPTALASTLDPQGNFIVAGRDPLDRLLVAKLDAQGELVPAFGQAGVWIAPSCGATEDDVAVATDLSGSIYAGVSCEGAATIFKLDAQGMLVGGFGSAGRAAGFFPATGTIGSLLAARDGGLYVGGVTPAAPGGQLAVSKLSPGGVPVAGFGINGLALPGAEGGQVNLLALDSTGMLYVGGASPLPNAPPLFPVPYVIFRLGG